MTQKIAQKTTLIAGCTAHAIQDGLSASIYVLLPILAQTFGLNYGQIGLFKGLKSLSQAVPEIFSGHATERYGGRRILLFGLTALGAGYLFLSMARGAGVVLLCFVLIGVGSAFHHAPSSALISTAFTQKARRRALGFYNSSGDAGKLVFTSGLSVALFAALSWQSVAFIYGGVSLLAGIAIFFVLKCRAIGQINPGKLGQVATDAGKSLGWGVLDRGKFAALLATVFFDSMVQSGVLTFAAFVMISKGVPTSIATVAAVLVLIGGMFGKALCGFLADRIGVRSAFALLQVLTALGLVLLAILPITASYILLPALGVVVQGTTSITYVIVNDLVHPERTARGYSMIYGASSFAALAGPMGFGLIGDQFGIEFTLTAMATTAIIAILPCWFLKPV